MSGWKCFNIHLKLELKFKVAFKACFFNETCLFNVPFEQSSGHTLHIWMAYFLHELMQHVYSGCPFPEQVKSQTAHLKGFILYELMKKVDSIYFFEKICSNKLHTRMAYFLHELIKYTAYFQHELTQHVYSGCSFPEKPEVTNCTFESFFFLHEMMKNVDAIYCLSTFLYVSYGFYSLL